MGHTMNVHSNIYAQRLVESDILHMGQILSQAAGYIKGNLQENSNLQRSTAWLNEFDDSSDEIGRQRPTYCPQLSPIKEIHTSPGTSVTECDVSASPIPQRECGSVVEKKTPQAKDRFDIKKREYVRTYKRTWTTPERAVLREAFHPYLKEKRQPTQAECQEVIMKKKDKSKSHRFTGS